MKEYRNKEIGNRGEELAIEYLLKQGYQIIERNWSHGKGARCTGEIDIIALNSRGDLSFIEVKSRENAVGEVGDFAPEAGFTKTKYKRLLSAINGYMQDVSHVGEISISLVAINILADGTNDIRFYEDMRIY
ncbi:MAG: YraN family protein [Rikenellaceae bacterium]